MDAKKRIDKILPVALERVQEEVSSLLGVDLKASPFEAKVLTKEEIFDNLDGKQVFSHIDYSGELEGVGGLIIGIKAAIRLGGTLIMLPPTELDEVAGREEYTEEIDDSYGEIANIVSGSFTKVFEEMYPKNFRFIRKEVEILKPLDVEVESDEPVPDQAYYRVGCTLSTSDVDLGWMYMLLPAGIFGLVEEQSSASESVPAGTAEDAKPSEGVTDTEPQAESDVQEPAPVSAEPAKPFDREKHKKRIDKILAECEGKLTEEVSALLGTKVEFSEHETSFISKEDFFFDEVDGKQVLANLEVVGDRPGEAFLYFGLKSSIHVGGILIMLPPTELENCCNEEEFNEDLKDSYGEIANIMAGVYSLAFEEKYPGQFRIVKKDLQQIVPMKVETESDEPMPNRDYYMTRLSVEADGKELGKLRLLFPTDVLQLDQQGQETEPPQPAEAPAQPAAPAAREATVEEETTAAPETGQPETIAPVDPDFDLTKQRSRIDKLLEECRSRMQTEVSELLGVEVAFEALDNRPVTKEDFFFDELSGKQVIANMDVTGDVEGKSYLFFSLKDAIHTGGVLIMLPSAELEKIIAEEEFNDDTNDAYGEIANIISGVYTAVFDEQYHKALRFIKTDLAQVVPMKVDPESEEPVPDVPYYMSGMSLSIRGEKKGKVHMLFPAELLQLEMLGREEELAAAQQTAAAAESQADTHGAKPSSKDAAPVAPTSPKAHTSSFVPADILVVSDDEGAASSLISGAEEKGYSVRRIGFKDDVRAALTSELKIVYLVMREVNEQAFGIAINVRTSSTLPLVAAGPGWTRSKVIKAVKYGVSDILLTPATAADIEESLGNNLARLAA